MVTLETHEMAVAHGSMSHMVRDEVCTVACGAKDADFVRVKTAAASTKVRDWLVEAPWSIATVAPLALPVLLSTADDGHGAFACLKGTQCGGRYVCNLSLQQQVLPARSAKEFEYLVPADAKVGQRMCVHSPDGMQVLTFVLPSELIRWRFVRVLLTESP